MGEVYTTYESDEERIRILINYLYDAKYKTIDLENTSWQHKAEYPYHHLDIYNTFTYIRV